MRHALIAAVSLCLLVGLVACNLVVTTTADPTPALDAQSLQVNVVTATPFGNPVVPTPFGQVNPSPDGTGTVATPGANFADWMINNVILPAWNFVYSFVMSALGATWDFAGARGGIFAQVLCCIGPAILLAVGLVRYALLRRGRK